MDFEISERLDPLMQTFWDLVLAIPCSVWVSFGLVF